MKPKHDNGKGKENLPMATKQSDETSEDIMLMLNHYSFTDVEFEKFRKKPVAIDAIQFNGNNFKEILGFIGGIDERNKKNIIKNTQRNGKQNRRKD